MIMTHASPLKISATCKELMELYTIRPIHDEIEYDNAVEMASLLAGLEPMTSDQDDYFDLLTDQIEKYDSEHYVLDFSDCTPLEMLKFLLEVNGMNGSDLGQLLGNRQLGGKILRGERQLSKTHIKILCERFNVSADLFLK